MQFIHEIMPDAVNGDREMISCNGLEMNIAEFQKLEPDYSSLPDNIMGFVYQPGVTHYFYDKAMAVTNVIGDVEPIVATNILDACLAKKDTYVGAINTATIKQMMKDWNTGSVDGNRAKRTLELKEEMRAALTKTDWYIIRHQEIGEAIPENIRLARNSMRKKMKDSEAALSVLTEMVAIKNHDANW